MNRSNFLFALLPLTLALAGCGGSDTSALPGPIADLAATTLNLGPFTTRVVGAAQEPVTSSAANGANVTGIAGALVDRLTLNGVKSLNNTRVAFYSNRDGNNEIYTMNPDGTGQLRITNNAVSDTLPAWSPDGTKLSFTSFRNNRNEIYSINADGTGEKRLTTTAGSDFDTHWSPDGTRILFHSTRDGNYEIYVMNADGTGQTRLTNNVAVDAFPDWSPDGSRITFYSTRDHVNGEIYVMDANGTGVTRLTNNTAIDVFPAV